MRELSLFTGAGGGLLGTRLMNWRCMGAAEIDTFCCERVAQRRDEGHLGEWFPVWNMDIRDFNKEVAPRYRGMVDVVSAGFPCQPFSVAGKQLGEDDERNMWPATIECIRVVRPRFCFMENVPGLVSAGYLDRIIGDLIESGYDCRWRILSAAEVGAPHKRDRLWIVADSTGDLWGASRDNRPESFAGRTNEIPNTESTGSPIAGWRGGKEKEYARPTHTTWWTTEPTVDRLAYGVADRVDRIKAAGNGQVPRVAATAWELLSE